MKLFHALAAFLTCRLLVAACEGPQSEWVDGSRGAPNNVNNSSSNDKSFVSGLRGKIEIQGSSSVEPISNQAQEKFNLSTQPHPKL